MKKFKAFYAKKREQFATFLIQLEMKANSKKVATAAAVGVIGAVVVPGTQVFAASGDPFSSTSSLATGTTTKIQGVGIAIIACVLAITGLVYAFAGRDLKAKIKAKWVDIAIACIVIFGATMLTSWIVSYVKSMGFNK